MILDIFLTVFFILTLAVSIFSLGIYFPYIPKIWEYATIMTSFFSIYSIIVTWVLSILSLTVAYFYPSQLSILLSLFSLLNLLAWSIPVVSLCILAVKNNISLNIGDNLNIRANTGPIQIDRSALYHSQYSQDLYLDYYPAYNRHTIWKPLVYVHGWGFTGWNRGNDPEWIEFFRTLWYDVFDVSYTLASDGYATWNIAGRDVQSALSWVWNNAEKYNIDIDELVVAGSSAGWTLALQAAYGWDTHFSAYNSETMYQAKKVIALFPAVDIKQLWDRDTEFYGIRSRDTYYIWWTPSEFPERYKTVNAMNLARNDAPETLIIHGGSDTLIPSQSVFPLSERLSSLWVKNRFIKIPYAQHWFTYFSGSFAFQISKGIIKKYLWEKL